MFIKLIKPLPKFFLVKTMFKFKLFKFNFKGFIRFIFLFFLGIILPTLMMLPSWSQVSPSALYQQALIDWQQGRTLNAIALWKEFVEKVTNSDSQSRGYLNLAQAYLEMGHFHKAREAWERGKVLAPPELSSLIAGIEGNIALAEKDFE
ncbi:MAG: tetratricopeptide repeat protein, partial [Microcystaceae cyanobacterium]